MLQHHNKKIFLLFSVCGLLSAMASGQLFAASLTVGSVSGKAGSTVGLPFELKADSSISAVQFSLKLPSSLSATSFTPGDIVTSAGKSVNSKQNGNTWTIIIFGMNQSAISSGKLMTAQLKIASGTHAGNLNVAVSGITFSDSNGRVIHASAQKTHGKISVTE